MEHYYYLSFCDPDLPEGQQFLGATIVKAADPVLAVAGAWSRGCNPGGEVLLVDLGVDLPQEASEYLNTFVPRERVLSQPHSRIEP